MKTRVVLLAEADAQTSGSGGTTRAHTVDQRLAAFQDMAPDEVEVAIAEFDPDASSSEMAKLLADADAIVALFAYGPPPGRRWRYFGEVLMPLVPQLPKLKLVQVLSSGFDEYLSADDVVALHEQRGITVANNGGANAVAVSEEVLGLIYALFRALPADVINVRNGLWNQTKGGESKRYLASLSGKDSTMAWGGIGGQEITNKTVGIIGFGNIGRQVARRLTGYDCEVLYHDVIQPVIGRESELGATFTGLDELLARADVVTLHVPHTGKTRGMMGMAQMKLMKKSAVLINTCRGPVVRQSELIAALEAGDSVFPSLLIDTLPWKIPSEHICRIVSYRAGCVYIT